MKTFIASWKDRFSSLGAEDEVGAESTEVILLLVVLVIGLIGAWAFLRGKITGQANRTGNCISNAGTASTC